MNKRLSRPQRRLLPEWITFLVALCIVAVIVGLVIYEWVTESNQPPILTISRQEIREAEGQFYVPFTVTNKGGLTAESVQVSGELQIEGQPSQIGDQQIDFLSSGEQQEGAFIFNHNPSRGELRQCK
ncbi:MAG: TIGR02588 family protein [Aphanocapsa sp. GSE-SYN-MK-11-07L]|jgi:uncharacterized protein (TIGR02588 family)|nr:TIGR02588 family protein [Aphanocapsa sp. GSE-SYN-MK-11-07L]